MTYYYGFIKLIKTEDGKASYRTIGKMETIKDSNIFQNELYALNKAYNNAAGTTINCKIQLLEEDSGKVLISIDEYDRYGDKQYISLDDIEEISEKISHYDDKTGITSEIIGITDYHMGTENPIIIEKILNNIIDEIHQLNGTIKEDEFKDIGSIRACLKNNLEIEINIINKFKIQIKIEEFGHFESTIETNEVISLLNKLSH